MTAHQFTQIGEDLYGRRWKTQMAEALGLERTTMFRYATGRRPIPDTVAKLVNDLARARRLRAVAAK